MFWLALAGGLLLQAVAVVWPPLASVLGTEPLGAADWLHTVGMAALALAAVEALKLLDAPRWVATESASAFWSAF